jgi:hypothetical protein
MSDDFSRFSYSGVSLLIESPGVRFSTGARMPAKLDPLKCAMESGAGVASVPIDETLAAAREGGRIGTELPPDQVL